MADDVLKAGATHILWLDADMCFPPDTLKRLLARKVPIVGANYRRRVPPHQFTAATGHRKNLREVETTEQSTGLESVNRLGFGVTLIESRVFQKITKPWFQFTYEQGQHGGEDEFFCRKANRAGFQPHVDHDLSKQVRHIGTFEVSIDGFEQDV